MEISCSTLRTSLWWWIVNKRALRGWLDAVCGKVPPILQPWSAAWLRNWQLPVYIWLLPGPKFWRHNWWWYNYISMKSKNKLFRQIIIWWLPEQGDGGVIYNIGVKSIGWNGDTLLNRHVSLRLRVKFFNSVIMPTVLFRIWTCPLTSNQLQQLEVVRNRMLRSTVGWAPLVNNEKDGKCTANFQWQNMDWEIVGWKISF